jgi:hypothetical protein
VGIWENNGIKIHKETEIYKEESSAETIRRISMTDE